MSRVTFRAGELACWVSGDGPPVLLLHGGPGLSYNYLDWLADELGSGHRLAAFQQRGLAPSTEDGPFDVPTCVAEVVAGHFVWHERPGCVRSALGRLERSSHFSSARSARGCRPAAPRPAPPRAKG